MNTGIRVVNDKLGGTTQSAGVDERDAGENASTTDPTNVEDSDDASDANGTRDSDAPDSDDARTGLSENEIFDVLRNSRRRAVLSRLLETDGEVSVSELSKHVASEEYGVPAEELSSDQYKRVYTGLYQCHLARLDDFGVVDFDRDAGTVRRREAAAQVESYLAWSGRRNAARLEVAAAAVVAPLVTVGATGVGPLGEIPVLAWATLTILALLGMALFQFYGTDAPTTAATRA